MALAQQHPDIVKVIAVGNEAMVHWAASYFRGPKGHLAVGQPPSRIESQGALARDLWVTCSDNLPPGAAAARNTTMKTWKPDRSGGLRFHAHLPFHDTHYNPVFWSNDTLRDKGQSASDNGTIEQAMERALAYSQNQYAQVVKYVEAIDESKKVHIGETGWASVSDGFYGPEGSRAADEYKQALFYHGMRKWTQSSGISCFYFEAFDEPWKSAANPTDSENHFGLFKADGEAKYALWPLVAQDAFDGLTRDGHTITNSYAGQREMLDRHVLATQLDHTSPIHATSHPPLMLASSFAGVGCIVLLCRRRKVWTKNGQLHTTKAPTSSKGCATTLWPSAKTKRSFEPVDRRPRPDAGHGGQHPSRVRAHRVPGGVG